MQLRARVLVFSAFVAVLAGCDQGTGPNVPGAPARVLISAGDNQAATVATELPLPIVVHVVDSSTRSVPNQLINFRVVSGGGSVFAGSALTNELGIAQERWTLGQAAGEQVVEARAVDSRTGLPIVFATFRAQAMPDRPDGLYTTAILRAGPVSAMLTDTPWVGVLDRFRNPVPNAVVQWSVVTGGGSVTAITPSTNQQGIARAAWTLGPAIGTQTMKASVAGLPDFILSATALVGPAAAIQVTPASPRVTAGASIQLQAAITDLGGNAITRAPTWSSSDTTIAVVDASGLVRGVRAGSVTIRTSLDAIVRNTTLIVDAPAVASVSISPATATIDLGTSTQLTATARDASGNPLPGTAITWSSSNEAVATVTTDGLVAGLTAGQATITASSAGHTATATITVRSQTSTALTIQISPNGANLAVNGQIQLTATVRDQFGAVLNSAVTWSSSMPAVAEVSAAGLLTGVSAGSTVITASVNAINSSIQVTVSSVTPVETVTVEPATATIQSGTTVTLQAIARDANGNQLQGRPVEWSSSEPPVLTVNANGVVTGQSAGNAIITATIEGKSGSASIQVTSSPSSAVRRVQVNSPTDSLTFSVPVQLTVVAYDSNNVVVSTGPATWIVSNGSITQNGLVTATDNRLNPVIVSAIISGVRDTRTFPVRARVGKVEITTTDQTLTMDGSVRFAAVVTDTANRPLLIPVTWTMSDSTIATISSTGEVTPQSGGHTLVIATAQGKADTAAVTVLPLSVALGVSPDRGPSAYLSAVVQAQHPIASIAGDINGRPIDFAFRSTLNRFTKSFTDTLSLGGLPYGPLLATVTVTDIRGNVARDTGTIVHDAPPILEIVSPGDLDVAAPNLAINVSCRTVDSPGCKSVKVYLIDDSSPNPVHVLIASGATSVQTSVDLSARARKQVRLIVVEVEDSSGLTVRDTRRVYVNSSTRLNVAAEVPGEIVDANATHILYMDSTSSGWSLWQRNRSSGANQLLLTDSRRPGNTNLTQFGAVATITRSIVDNRDLVDLRPGSAPVMIGGANLQVAAAGRYVVWVNYQNIPFLALYRRDLATGTTVMIAPDSVGYDFTVMPNGDVYYSTINSSADIWRYSDGAGATRLTNDPLRDSSPRSDGSSVVFTRTNPTSPPQLQTVLLSGGVETVLAPPGTSGGSHAVNNGWVLYQRTSVANGHQFRRRSPAGVDVAASFQLGPPILEVLADDGTVGFHFSNRRYLNLPSSSDDLSIGEQQGISVVIGGRIYLAIGRKLFSIQY